MNEFQFTIDMFNRDQLT